MYPCDSGLGAALRLGRSSSPFTILYRFHVIQFVLSLLPHKQALYGSIAILYNTHYYSVTILTILYGNY